VIVSIQSKSTLEEADINSKVSFSTRKEAQGRRLTEISLGHASHEVRRLSIWIDTETIDRIETCLTMVEQA
jgi:hypothetical protein